LEMDMAKACMVVLAQWSKDFAEGIAWCLGEKLQNREEVDY
jgi:hypothetical protein